MLHQQMCTSDFAVQALSCLIAFMSEVGRVVLAHVMLQRLTVGIGRRLPSRLLCLRVEIVRQVLAGVTWFLLSAALRSDDSQPPYLLEWRTSQPPTP